VNKRVPVLTVVVPCYNEEEVIQECHRQLTAALSKLEEPYEIVYVNDGSRDRTLNLLHGIQLQDECVVVVSLSRNFGHQVAVSAGLEYASGESVGVIDADLQDPPEVLVDMYRICKEGYDVVYGVRSSRTGESTFKLWTAKVFYRIINRLSDVEIPLDTGDFRVMSRKAVDALLMMKERHRLLRGMSSWVGFRQYGLPYARAKRHAGITKYPLKRMVTLALDGILSFSIVPLRLVSYAGLAASVLAVLGILYALVLRLFTRVWVPGWTLLFIGILFMGGIQMLSIGVVGEYVGRIYSEAKQRPLFLVQEVLGSRVESRNSATKTVRGDA